MLPVLPFLIGGALGAVAGNKIKKYYDALQNGDSTVVPALGQAANIIPQVAQVVIGPARKPVTYNATIAKAGYSIDSHPWGENGFTKWGNSDDLIGKTFYFYEENGSNEYANGMGLGWIDKRAIEVEKKVVASILYLPDGQTWTVYDEGSEYKVGQVISTEAPGEDDGLYLTVLGDKGNNILIVDLQKKKKKAIYFDKDKGATITQKFA